MVFHLLHNKDREIFDNIFNTIIGETYSGTGAPGTFETTVAQLLNIHISYDPLPFILLIDNKDLDTPLSIQGDIKRLRFLIYMKNRKYASLRVSEIRARRWGLLYKLWLRRETGNRLDKSQR